MKRVAALLPAATEIIVALDGADELVAITHACTQPPGKQSLPRVTRSRVGGSTPQETDRAVSELSASGAALFELDVALLASTRPDVILTQTVCDVCAVRADDVIALAAGLHPVPDIVSLRASDVDGVLGDVRTIGQAVGRTREAAVLLAGLEGRIRAVHGVLKEGRAPRPRVAVVEWTAPPFSAGHWVPDMVRRAGGEEALGIAATPSRRVTVDDIRAADPDVIIVAPCGVELDEACRQAESIRSQSDWDWSSGRAWWAIDAGRLTSSPGPGVVEGIEVLARILHPGLFGLASPACARPVAFSPLPPDLHAS